MPAPEAAHVWFLTRVIFATFDPVPYAPPVSAGEETGCRLLAPRLS